MGATRNLKIWPIWFEWEPGFWWRLNVWNIRRGNWLIIAYHFDL